MFYYIQTLRKIHVAPGLLVALFRGLLEGYTLTQWGLHGRWPKSSTRIFFAQLFEKVIGITSEYIGCRESVCVYICVEFAAFIL